MGTESAEVPETSFPGTIIGHGWSRHAGSLKCQFWMQEPGMQCLGPQCPGMLGPGTHVADHSDHLEVLEALGPGVWQVGAQVPDGGKVQHGRSLLPTVTTGI